MGQALLKKSDIRHAERVMAVVRKRSSGQRYPQPEPRIAWWRRCITEHGLDPAAPREHASGNLKRVTVAPAALQRLLAYDWPGNIRELRNVSRTAIALADGGVVRVHDLPHKVASFEARAQGGERPGDGHDHAGVPAARCPAAGLRISRSTVYRRKLGRFGIDIGFTESNK